DGDGAAPAREQHDDRRVADRADLIAGAQRTQWCGAMPVSVGRFHLDRAVAELDLRDHARRLVGLRERRHGGDEAGERHETDQDPAWRPTAHARPSSSRIATASPRPLTVTSPRSRTRTRSATAA